LSDEEKITQEFLETEDGSKKLAAGAALFDRPIHRLVFCPRITWAICLL